MVLRKYSVPLIFTCNFRYVNFEGVSHEKSPYLHEGHVPHNLDEVVVPVVELDTSNGVGLGTIELNPNQEFAPDEFRRDEGLLLLRSGRPDLRAQMEEVATLLARPYEHGDVHDGADSATSRFGDSDRDEAVGDVLVAEGGSGHVVLAGVTKVGTFALAGEAAPEVGAVAPVHARVGGALGLPGAAGFYVVHGHRVGRVHARVDLGEERILRHGYFHDSKTFALTHSPLMVTSSTHPIKNGGTCVMCLTETLLPPTNVIGNVVWFTL